MRWMPEALGLNKSTCSRHLTTLREAGLLESGNLGGIAVVEPSGGWSVHRHDHDDPCPGMIVDSSPSAKSCTRIAPVYSLASKISKSLSLHVKDKRNQKSIVNARESEIFVQFYRRARRRMDAGYTITPGDRKAATQIVSRFRELMVGADCFEDYIYSGFDLFHKIRRDNEGMARWAPMNFLKSDYAIDAFVAGLGRREMNVEGAQKMLTEAGHTGVSAGMVCTIARRCWEEETLPPDTISPEYKAAVEFVLTRYRDIGYRSEET